MPFDAEPFAVTERLVVDERFADIQQELEKQKANQGAVRVADLLEEKEKDDAKKASADGAKDEKSAATSGDPAVIPSAAGMLGGESKPDDRSPQVDEALRILGDLVAAKRPVATASRSVTPFFRLISIARVMYRSAAPYLPRRPSILPRVR